MTKKNTKITKIAQEQKTQQAPNLSTSKAGLVFNVNSFKSDIKKYFKGRSDDMHKPPLCKGGHIVIAACVQKMCELIVKDTLKHTSINRVGLRTVTPKSLKLTLVTNDCLTKYYLHHMSSYNYNIMYWKNLPVLEKDIRQVIENVSKDLEFGSKSVNLLFFLLTTFYFDILNVSNQFLRFSGKKSFESRVIVFAIKNRFSDDIASELCSEISRVSSAMEDEIDAVDEIGRAHV